MEEEQKRQISLIKQVPQSDTVLIIFCFILLFLIIFCFCFNSLFFLQVTEREHQRMISELSAKHREELTRLKTELTVELRESLEAAHQAELQQVQVLQK